MSARIDKWLWMVRLFKSRTLATEACKSGDVRSDDERVKPSRDLKPGDVLTVRKGPLIRTVRVVGFPENRVGAKLVPDYLEDLTPPDAVEAARQRRGASGFFRETGEGRPTKKDRRDLDELRGE